VGGFFPGNRALLLLDFSAIVFWRNGGRDFRQKALCSIYVLYVAGLDIKRHACVINLDLRQSHLARADLGWLLSAGSRANWSGLLGAGLGMDGPMVLLRGAPPRTVGPFLVAACNAGYFGNRSLRG